jgi:hypothetical protein
MYDEFEKFIPFSGIHIIQHNVLKGLNLSYAVIIQYWAIHSITSAWWLNHQSSCSTVMSREEAFEKYATSLVTWPIDIGII